MKKYFDSRKEREEFIQKANIIVLDYGVKKIDGTFKHWVEYKRIQADLRRFLLQDAKITLKSFNG